MKTVTLKATLRTDAGKKSAKALRREDLVPGVIYGGKENVSFAVAKKDLKPIIYTSEFFNVVVEVDGKTYKTICKDMDFDPITDEITHIDFQELVPGRKVKTSIPVHLEGRPVGVADGGILQHKLRTLRVRIKPEDMVEHFTLDVRSLQLDKSMKVSALQVGDIEVLDSPSIPIASVISPRTLRSAKTLAVKSGTEEGAEETAEETEA